MNNNKLKFTVYGNCQANAIAQKLLSNKSFSEKYEYIHIDPCFLITEKTLLEFISIHKDSFDLLITQNLKTGWNNANNLWDVESIGKVLKSDGKLFRYTDLYHRFVNPLLVYPKNFVRFERCDYIDLVSLTLSAQGYFDPNLCQEIYTSETLLSDTDFRTIGIISDSELRNREQGLEIQVASEISKLCNHRPAFYTFNHPANYVLSIVANSIFDLLEIENNISDKFDEDPLSTIQFPLPGFSKQFYINKQDIQLSSQFHVSHFDLEAEKGLSMNDYFTNALKDLQTIDSVALRNELESQRVDGISSIIITSIERYISNKMSISIRSIQEIGMLNSQGITPNFLLEKANPQAIGFMSDIVSFIRDALLPFHLGETLTVLDLGAKSAAGSNLLAYLGQVGSYAKLKFLVTCADIDPTFLNYSAAANPYVEYIAGDAFEQGKKWDIVICSHVIEHVPDVNNFIEKLKAISSRYIILAFPFAEDEKNLIPGHINSLSHEFIRSIKPIRYSIYDGLFWSQSMCCIVLLDANNKLVEC